MPHPLPQGEGDVGRCHSGKNMKKWKEIREGGKCEIKIKGKI
jgi:hypothetical protein